MLELKSLNPKTERIVLREAQHRAAYDPKQRRLMLIALSMLLVALGFVVYRNRDFWFPDAQDADFEQPAEAIPAATDSAATTSVPTTKAIVRSSKRKHKGERTKAASADAPVAASAAVGATATTNRTVLPPLEVEVIAGDTHSTVRPGSTSVRVDLQPGSPPGAASEVPVTKETASAANLTSNAAERVQMSAGTAEVVSHPVNPGYPLLARQMKVQGSVILQALVGKDGIIQDLRVLSGPGILASAALAAVRQWHFKPHFENNEPVETQAKITVNFTISTN